MTDTEGGTVTMKASFDAPRWARSDLALKEACFICDVELEMTRDTTLLREIVLFEMTGKRDNINRVVRAMNRTIEDWNNG